MVSSRTQRKQQTTKCLAGALWNLFNPRSCINADQFSNGRGGHVGRQASCFGGAGACSGGTARTDRSVCWKPLRRWTRRYSSQRDEFYLANQIRSGEGHFV